MIHNPIIISRGGGQKTTQVQITGDFYDSAAGGDDPKSLPTGELVTFTVGCGGRPGISVYLLENGSEVPFQHAFVSMSLQQITLVVPNQAIVIRLYVEPPTIE